MRRFLSGVGVLLAALWVAPLGAQETTGKIRGRVTDQASQQPIQGATVTFGSRSAVTQFDGRYYLNGARAVTDTLRVRMIGYTPVARVVTVGSNEIVEVDLTLSPQAVNLAELVVIGYGEQRAGNIAGSVTAVTSEEFNTGNVINATELIQNKAAGVQVVESNEPGGGTSIRIRGSNSVNASSEPLIVIDGMPIGASNGAGSGLSAGRDALNFLNPHDIESITVLRDASSAAIYGSNGANGVLLVTTKKGSGRPRVEYSGSLSASSADRFPSMMNAQQFRAAVLQYADTSGSNQLLNANTNWFDLVDRTAIGQEHNAALSGTGGSMDYRFSLNYLNQDGVLQGTRADRVSLGVNYNQRLFGDRLSLRSSIRGSRSHDFFTPDGVLANAAQMGPTQPVTDPTSTTGFYEWPGNRLTSADNPVAILELATNEAKTLRGVGNVQAEYQIPFVTGLRANATIGFDVTDSERETFTPSVLHSQQKTGTDGTYFRRNVNQTNTVVEGYLNYGVPQNLGPGALDVTGGYSYASSNMDSTKLTATGLSTDLLGPDGLPGALTIQNQLDVQNSKLISVFGRANYNINDRYLVALSLRRDGSSRFGPGNQWGTFPSAAVAWRLSEEPFMDGFGSLSDLKLRAAWGRTGNQAFPNYLPYSTYQVGDAQSQYQFGDTVITTIRPGAVDPEIKWEETRSYDLGLDFGIMNQRVTGSIDWYDKKTTDLIFTVPVSAGSNLSNFVTTNIGSMKNQGFEFSVRAEMLQGGSTGLSWTADLNASHNSNELLTINPILGEADQILAGLVAGGVGTFIQVLTPGEPINSFLVYEHIRENGKPIYKDVNGSGVDGQPNGTINEQDLYKDQNGDGIITVADRRPFKDPAPKWILGHSSYLSYHSFDFGFTLRAYLGNYVYNNVASNLGNFQEVTRGSPYNLHTSVLETGFETPQYLSDFYVEDASFLRMDNLTLGYSFNYRGVPARVFGNVRNAFTISGYSGVDPTAGLNGLDNNIYPRSRTFTAGLTFNF